MKRNHEHINITICVVELFGVVGYIYYNLHLDIHPKIEQPSEL